MKRRILNKAEKILPDFVSRFLVNIPYRYRYGKSYTEFSRTIQESKKWSESELMKYAIAKFDAIFQHAKSFDFYFKKFKQYGVLELKVHSLNDIKKIPLLSKQEIRDNIGGFNGFYKQQTGGTTGNPLPLYLDREVWDREAAHIHHIWRIMGYKQSDALFTFRDCDKGDQFLKYNFQLNEYFFNIYKIFNMSKEDLSYFFKILAAKKVKYLYGYPSAINDFLRELERRVGEMQKQLFKKHIKGCLLASEYPTSRLVKRLKNWNLDFISWYGHSEICVLANAPVNSLEYEPFYTYGFPESHEGMLVGTSYNNFSMPLIRYNTEDRISTTEYTNGLIKSFKVKDGRIDDFILDKNNYRIPIMTMLECVDPEVFKYLEYVQAFQEKKGTATLLITQNETKEINAKKLMNLTNYDLDFDFIYLNEPIRTPSGKISLKVQNLPN